MIFNKFYIILLIFLTACNSSANQSIRKNIEEKVFELDLTNEGISAEGGGIELYKDRNFCSLLLNIYGENGQEKYNFKFKKNNLIETSYLKYRYKNGLLVTDDELKDLIADDSTNSDNDMELVSNKSFIGSTNKNIAKKFDMYKKRIPKSVLTKNCN
ncbi:hypothetical protein F925_00541 [Acinetobacter lwoffii NCTC 5866 = CIP 64.10 = NIPH 512]|uniref:hypothetical protein n=1 Tax=Acinetobacter sp. YH12103 TaxID=2601092 RepID=UPI0002CD7437|nr:hypothetical protein [Acinetobacter sp. YH12103]ENW26059.1 hypothetical protein F925_00541 [Acinetobacter lwoffii NCTC 5866 = CIP 64.10 = NIPH 512]MBU3847779.1 hypothetical protein [Candidatus Acinetobacter avistercoris]